MTRSLLVLAAFVGLAAAPACQPAFPGIESSQQLSVTITSGATGSPEGRLLISFSTPAVFTVDIQALDANGVVDKSFNGFVRASAVPGAVQSVTGPKADGRNVQLVNGEAKGIQIAVVEAYGDARIQIEDVGYVPADPLRVPPPECADGIDNNHNGKIDYPTDPGCYAANDDTEEGGTYAAAVSTNIYFQYPRIADVRGVAFGGSTTPFPNQQVQINTGWLAPNAPYGVVVTGVGSAGFYVTDLGDLRGYTSIYAYTYAAPAIMLPCDRLITFGGTAGEFYGFAEMNYPTWSLEEWDPTVRPCLVPEPVVYLASDLSLTSALIAQEAALVRIAKSSTTSGTTVVSTAIHVGADFGPGLVDQKTYMPDAAHSDCDYNGDGKIDYTAGGAEDLCATACTADVECTEYSGYLTENQFRIVVVTTTTTPTGSNMATGSITADASADASFIPTAHRGLSLGGFTGNLIYFSGGTTFTIQARCADDVIVSENQTPFPSSCDERESGGILVQKDPKCHAACVVARNATSITNAN
jgi:hypothetical protein